MDSQSAEDSGRFVAALKMAPCKGSCTGFSSFSTAASSSGDELTSALCSEVSVEVASAFSPPRFPSRETCQQQRPPSERGLTLPHAAVFLLGVCCVLPWDSLVADMNAFEHLYFPSFRWIETATQVPVLRRVERTHGRIKPCSQCRHGFDWVCLAVGLRCLAKRCRCGR